jgi:LysM repeat protein
MNPDQISTYTVKAGDTASRIASQYGVPLSAISGYKSGDANKIGVGEVLKIAKTPTPPVNTAPAAVLGGSAYTAAPATVSTAPTSLIGLAEITQKNIESLQPKVDQGEKDIKTVYDKISTKASERQNLYETTGVNTAKKELDEISNTMKARQNAFNNSADKIRNENPTGQLSEGQQIQLDKLSREHASEMADLAIVAEAKQGNFTTAKAIVDSKIDAETEDLKTQLSSLEFFYNRNEGRLSDSQKTLLQQQTDAVRQELADKKDMLEKIGSIQLAAAKNGASASTIRSIGKAGTVEDAITLAGSSISDGGSSGANFTTTQVNSGAATAGLAPAEFKNLPVNVQNYYINNGSSAKAFNQSIQDITNGDADFQDVVDQISSSALADDVKTYLTSSLSSRFPQGSDTGGGFWSSVGNFFKGAYNKVLGQ